ncbi:cobalt-precorrin-6A reductase [Pseudorhodoferax sp. LjRoot39]|uniref:cobalt-precorrin-6A reductase n=1 Tax=Pseudorhodoferax sp. LjRoot39 TaxID=3342328 RepID=UPI003ECC59BA
MPMMSSQRSATPRLLLLGGTTEARQLADALAAAGVDAVYSYAGRTLAPRAQPLPTRVGGFGGVSGLSAWLRAQRITQVVDATHPFAARISANAGQACAALGIPLLALERPAWVAQAGDDWREVPDVAAAVAALPAAPTCVFLAIGRQTLDAFAQAPQHHYLLRLVDAPLQPLPLPQATLVLDRGPFTVEGDRQLMRAHGSTHVVAKNAGGSGARAKLDAARSLGLPVVLVQRPQLPPRTRVGSVAEAMAWLAAHRAALGV